MHSRARQLWAFGGSLALFLLLALTSPPKVPNNFTGSSTGMSAPSAPKAFVEAELLAPLVRSDFECLGQPVRVAVSAVTLRAGGAEVRSRQTVKSESSCYAPLHRRPPPVLS